MDYVAEYEGYGGGSYVKSIYIFHGFQVDQGIKQYELSRRSPPHTENTVFFHDYQRRERAGHAQQEQVLLRTLPAVDSVDPTKSHTNHTYAYTYPSLRRSRAQLRIPQTVNMAPAVARWANSSNTPSNRQEFTILFSGACVHDHHARVSEPRLCNIAYCLEPPSSLLSLRASASRGKRVCEGNRDNDEDGGAAVGNTTCICKGKGSALS